MRSRCPSLSARNDEAEIELDLILSDPLQLSRRWSNLARRLPAERSHECESFVSIAVMISNPIWKN
jgi:hypothetical protein